MELNLITFGVLQNLSELALATAGILGLTGLLGKIIPEKMRDTVLPFSAMAIGIILAVAFQISHEGHATIMGILFGILFGGAVTGLYDVTKQIKQY